MSTRFWLASSGVVAGAIVAGLSLGAYAVSPPRSAWADDAAATLDVAVGAVGSSGVDDRPSIHVVHCKGCGPTLAERQRAADLAGLDLDSMISETRDPVVLDYAAQDKAALIEPAPPPPSRLPPMAERLAAANAPAPPPQFRQTVPIGAVIQPIAVTTAPAP
ncbi:MAG: hypothetical protein ABW039_13060 [Sphingobium sp.]